MARVWIPLAASILSAALFGSVLGKAKAPSPAPMSVSGLAPSPVLGQAPSPTPVSVSGLAPSPVLAFAPESSYGPALPPGPDCLTPLYNLSDCLTYVSPGSNLTVPDKPCCGELASLVDSNPICLCTLLGDPDSIGLTIDVNRALKLPSVCDVTTPSVSLCAAIGIPVAAPMASEGPSAPGGISMSPSSVASVPSKPENGASRSILSAEILGAAVLVSVFF